MKASSPTGPTRVKIIGKIVSGATPDSTNTEYWDGDIVWVTPADLGRLEGYRLTTSERRISEVGYRSCGTSLSPENSIIVSVRAPIGHLAVSAVPSCTNQGCKTIVPHSADGRFIYYALWARRGELLSLGTGSTFMEMSADSLGGVRLWLPEIPIQRRIADFLDCETTKIDALIAEKERLLKLLDERRQALITEAVTRGLDPNVPMKPSGLPWLGDIPTHWEEVPIGRLFRLVSGGTPSKDRPEFWDGDIPWVSAKDMKSIEISDTEDHISPDGMSASNLDLLPAGTLLLVVRGMILAHTIPISICRVPVTVNQDMKGMVARRPVDSFFVARQLAANSAAFFATREESAHGTKALRTDDVKKVSVFLPPLHEQTEISGHVGSIESAHQTVEQHLQEVRSLLAHRRSSLIHEAVTGQLFFGGAT